MHGPLSCLKLDENVFPLCVNEEYFRNTEFTLIWSDSVNELIF